MSKFIVTTLAIAAAAILGFTIPASSAPPTDVETLNIGSSNKGCVTKSSDFERARVTRYTVRGCESGLRVSARYDMDSPGQTYRLAYRIRSNNYVISVKDGYLRAFRGRFENGCKVKIRFCVVRQLTEACENTLVTTKEKGNGNSPNRTVISVIDGRLEVFSPYSGDLVAAFDENGAAEYN
jgi:hypothetical protein